MRDEVARRWAEERALSDESARLLAAVVEGVRGDALAARLGVPRNRLTEIEMRFAAETHQGVYNLARHLSAVARLV